MNKPTTLQELRDFFDSIPEDKWCVKKRGEMDTDVHCAFGHIVAQMWDPYTLSRELKFSHMDLIQANDYSHLGPKAGVLQYLDKQLQ